MAEIASAYVSLLPSARGFGSKLDSEISGDIDKSGKKNGLSFGKVFAAGAAIALGKKAFDFLGDSLAEATEAAVVGSRTENVIAKMGNAANISADQVSNLAEAISNKTGIDDEAIQSGQNLLLTFANIRNEAGKGNNIFDQTSQIMVDMSAAMGTDAKGSAIQLGKALNDPIKGISSLSRAGVQFTEQQKAQIATMVESGNTLGAQKIILGELEKQFGGAAESMATPADKAKVAWANFKEEMGTRLLPVVNDVLTAFTTKVVPALTKVADNLDTIAPVLGIVATGMLAFKVASLASAAASAIMAAGTAGATTATWSLNAALRANPIGIVVTALTLLAAGLVIAYKKSDTFRAIVDGAFSAIKTAATAMGADIKIVMSAMKAGFETVGKAGTSLWNNALQPAFKFIVTGISSILSLWASMLTVLGKVPGFGWAKDAAEAMGKAAEKASDLAAGIQKIPDKTVHVTIAYQYTGLKDPTRGQDQSALPRGMVSAGTVPPYEMASGSSVTDELRALRADVVRGLRQNALDTGAGVGDALNGAAAKGHRNKKGGK